MQAFSMLHNQMQRLREKESFCKPPCFALHTVLGIRCVLPEVLKSLTDSGLYSVIVLTTLQKRCSDHGSDELVDFEKKSRKVVWGHWARMQSPQSSVQSDSGQTVSSRLQALHRQRLLQALDPATGGKNPPPYVKLSLKPIWVWKVLGTKDVPCFLGARKKSKSSAEHDGAAGWLRLQLLQASTQLAPLCICLWSWLSNSQDAVSRCEQQADRG